MAKQQVATKQSSDELVKGAPMRKAGPAPAAVKPVSAPAPEPNRPQAKKSLGITSGADLSDDTRVFGDPDTWQLICKASNEREGWMKSTKALVINRHGLLVQVSTQQRNPDGSYAVAEALTFVPDAGILIEKGSRGVTRRIVYKR